MKRLLLWYLNKITIDKEFALSLLIEIVNDTNNKADTQALKEVILKLKNK